MNGTVLVVDGLHDAATDLIVQALPAAGAAVFRMDTAQFPRALRLAAVHDDRGDGWTGALVSGDRTVRMEGVRAVYWNRPGLFTFEGLSESDAHWARGAARIGFGGVLASLDARWMNHPARASAAEFKPLQLKIARAAGLDTPRTLVTNDPDHVEAFARAVNGPLITKSLGSPFVAHEQVRETIYTRAVDLDQLDGIEITAHLFQEEIAKDHEIRLVWIDGVCHSVRIDARSAAARVDWRADYDALDYTLINTPKAIEASVGTYMDAMGLTYAALDFIVRPDATWTFLEANPSGQWAWLNSPTLPLAQTIADALTRWCNL
ncbi:MvdC/MvdD family ATP grasp protein [Streptomyces sp. MNP-20]|uniref:MvdC/MvdD family ATP grasp protein n=1 Tax=Streptomyces sp. MNP-20 TaxID=2721165 RepID=UPI00155767E9|nr:hypothetical protein [Streptomyces sp. MNP-20]